MKREKRRCKGQLIYTRDPSGERRRAREKNALFAGSGGKKAPPPATPPPETRSSRHKSNLEQRADEPAVGKDETATPNPYPV